MKRQLTVPRIIGIILLVIAGLAYKTQGKVQVTLIALAGLVLLLTPKTLGGTRWQEFLASLKLKKHLVFIMLFDIMFWALIAILSLILANVLRGPIEQLKGIQLGAGVAVGAIAAYNEIIESVFTTAIVTLIVFWLFVVASYTLSRGLIWLTLLNTPMQKQFFLRFCVLNLIWLTIWIAIMLFGLSTQQPKFGAVIFIILLLVYTHLTTVLHHSYARHGVMSKAVGEAFGIGLGKLGLFLHPFVYMFIIYVIISQVLRLATDNAALVVTIIIYLIFMAWYRTYMRDILRHA